MENNNVPKYSNPGPWDKEPDKDSFESSGYPCVMKRVYGGVWAGYVGVPESHPLHGIDYTDSIRVPDAILNRDVDLDKLCLLSSVLQSREDVKNSMIQLGLAIDVHKGVTFSGKLSGVSDSDWFFGFDCGHAGDLMPEYTNKAFSDNNTYRTYEYVKEQCEKLAEQLAAIESMG